ncbi:MAG TPA: metal-dependent transcriptional regulator [Candidatus Brocadiia bacterium]|nr:metal-dependent transcriptional regulator [Candidatus Brocadiia bacterium]
MPDQTALSPSQEDYLETIFLLVREKSVARVKDIATRMGVHVSSVTGALKGLSAKGLINYDPYSYVTLTDDGELLGKGLARKHEVLRDFLIKVLSVEPETAERNACHMEHAVEPDVMERLVHFVEFVDRCPRAGFEWRKDIEDFCSRGGEPEDCAECVAACLKSTRSAARKAVAGDGPKRLWELEAGDKARVTRVKTGGPAMDRLSEGGVERGATLEVESVAPTESFMMIKARGYHLRVPRHAAERIRVNVERTRDDNR